MTCNIYEEPNLMDVRYSKGVREDRGERVDRLVDIYESVDTEHHVHISARDRDVQRNPATGCMLILVLLYILLLAGGGVLSKFYIQTVAEKEEVNNAYKSLQSEFNQQLCQNITGWQRFRCSCYYKSTEKKYWNDSREDCKSKGADLVVINNRAEHEFVSGLIENGCSWIGLQREETADWHNRWIWKWVDGTQLEYQAWQVGVNASPEYRTTACVSQGWAHSQVGRRQWICEKEI